MPLSELLFLNGNKALVKKQALTYNKFMLQFWTAAEGLLFRMEIRCPFTDMKSNAGIVQNERTYEIVHFPYSVKCGKEKE